MMDRKTETINLGGGIEYAKVSSRSAEFHKDNDKCSVETSCEFKDGYALFTARVTTRKGIFTGHSMGKVNQQKAFEKLETISVGRALAFAGYLATGDIATYEEMVDVVTKDQLNSLKIKYATVYKDVLEGMDRVQKQEKFHDWCAGILGDDADYAETGAWDRESFQTCWRNLAGPDSDVPFGGVDE